MSPKLTRVWQYRWYTPKDAPPLGDTVQAVTAVKATATASRVRAHLGWLHTVQPNAAKELDCYEVYVEVYGPTRQRIVCRKVNLYAEELS